MEQKILSLAGASACECIRTQSRAATKIFCIPITRIEKGNKIIVTRLILQVLFLPAKKIKLEKIILPQYLLSILVFQQLNKKRIADEWDGVRKHSHAPAPTKRKLFLINFENSKNCQEKLS